MSLDLRRHTINVRDGDRTIARFSIELAGSTAVDVIQASESHRLVAGLRRLPRALVRVDVDHPLLRTPVLPFNIYQGSEMNIFETEAILDREKAAKASEQSDGSARVLYICPDLDKKPDDGLLNYTTFDVFADLLKIAEHSVVLVRPDQFNVLKAVEHYGPVLGLDFKILTGVAGADYSAAFDDATWSFERVAYGPFIADLTDSINTAKTIAAQEKGAFGKEQASFTRANGTVKAFTSFNGPSEDDGPDEEIKL